jgi:hypothetical protein
MSRPALLGVAEQGLRIRASPRRLRPVEVVGDDDMSLLLVCGTRACLATQPAETNPAGAEGRGSSYYLPLLSLSISTSAISLASTASPICPSCLDSVYTLLEWYFEFLLCTL